jgi:hypothetical protein
MAYTWSDPRQNGSSTTGEHEMASRSNTPRSIGAPGRGISAKDLFAEVAVKRGEYEAALAGLTPAEREAKINADKAKMVRTMVGLSGTGVLIAVEK